MKFNGVEVPAGGKITYSGAKFVVPNNPIVPFIEGDGTGRDIWKASQLVFDNAVEKVSKGARKVVWFEVLAGEKSFQKFGTWLPDDTLAAIQEFRIEIWSECVDDKGRGRGFEHLRNKTMALADQTSILRERDVLLCTLLSCPSARSLLKKSLGRIIYRNTYIS